MPSASEQIQRVFKTLSDPTRMRILHLLEREELVVQELMEVLGMAQSRVSRHLAILREAGLLQDRRDGTYVSYRFVPPPAGPWQEGWALVKRNLTQDATGQRDLTLLAGVIEARSADSRSFFDAVGPEWDALRKVFNDDVLRARAAARLLEPGLRVVDVGTGTGILACELAHLGAEVVGIDHSTRMIDAARAKLEREHFPHGAGVELRRAEANRMPLADSEMDAAFAHMALQYAPSPGEVIREMKRVLKPGGVLVVVDFVEHSLEWMRQELGVRWMGFDLDELRRWFDACGLPDVRIERAETPGRGRDLPATFIASARRP